jgi:hypothetical protein
MLYGKIEKNFVESFFAALKLQKLYRFLLNLFLPFFYSNAFIIIFITWKYVSMGIFMFVKWLFACVKNLFLLYFLVFKFSCPQKLREICVFFGLFFFLNDYFEFYWNVFYLKWFKHLFSSFIEMFIFLANSIPFQPYLLIIKKLIYQFILKSRSYEFTKSFKSLKSQILQFKSKLSKLQIQCV